MSTTKKVLFTVLTAICTACCLFSVFLFLSAKPAKADAAALEAEFTNDGQFAVSMSAWNDTTFTYIDGTSIGGTGAVLQLNRGPNSGTAAFRLDFTATGLRAADVEKIVIRIKADNFVLGTDEFRTSKDAGQHWTNYGKSDDLNNWYEYTLNAATIAQLTNDDGTLGYTDIVIRTYTAGLVAYVDSVTVTQSLALEFTGGGQFDIQTSNWGDTFEFIDGTSVGGTGVVLKINRSGTGTALFKLDLSATGLRAADVERIVIRIKADNFTLGTDEFRTSKLTGADWVNYGKTDDLSSWHDYTLNAATIAQLTNNDGTLGSTDIGIRAYTAGLIAYIDSITIVRSFASEFTNGGQFEIKASVWGDTFEYIDGTSIGGTGAVLKIYRHDGTGTASFRLDFTSTGLRAANVESISIRIKADNFVLGTDEFKTSKLTGADWVNYGTSDDLNSWHEYTFKAGTMAQLTNNDGTLGYTDVAIRTFSAGLIAYVDSITVVLAEGADLEAEFTNNAQFDITESAWGNELSYIDGTAVGGEGAVLQVNHLAGTAAFRLDFTGKNILAEDLSSIVVRIKADNFTLGSDEFKTSKLTGADWVNYGKTDDLSSWHDYTLNAATIAQLTNNDGTLGYTDIAIRTDNSNLVAYVDSITVILVSKPTVVCQGIANDVNNNILEPGSTPKYRTLLKYDIALGASANSMNVVSTTGQGILLNGVALSEIPNVSIDYGHGSKYIQIRIPQSYQDALTGDIILEVIEGTAFENQILDYAKFVLRSGQWATYKAPEAVKFAAILWNNAGKDIYEGKNGVLLAYSENLSNVSGEIYGSMKETNLTDTELGENVRLDGIPLKDITGAEIMYFGSSLLWIYAPNMISYRELTVESTEFIVAILPETHFAVFGQEWAESFKITHTINGAERVTYCRKNGKTLLGEKYYADLFKDEDISVKLVSFKVGDTVYGSGDTLIVAEDTEVTATVIGFETELGAYVRLLNPTGIRFETRVNKENYDYLVSVYGEENVEMGTYIVPKALLGLAEFGKYFADDTKEEGEDYRKIVNQGFANATTAETDGFYKFYGSLVNIRPNNYCTLFFGIGYIKITDGSDEYVLYGGSETEDHTRSIYNVSKFAYKDYSVGTSESNALKKYLDGVVPIISGAFGVEIENTIQGYTSPYSINYDSVSGEYTISGESEVKSVLINGAKKSEGANLIGIDDEVYKLTNYDLNAAAESTVRFKLSPISKATDLIDFTVKIPSDGELKILQLTDTQIIDSSQMRTPNRLTASMIEMWSPANIDKNCFNYITELIESENPDLIILTGDIIYGEFDDNGEIWTRIVDFMDSFGIPWAPIFGNHDNESAKGVEWQCAKLEAAKNCLFKKGNLTGNGNYSIGIVDDSGKIRRVIYMLDSNGCLNDPMIADDQISWFKSVSAAIDGAYGEKVPAFMCYHIPSLDFQTAFVEKYGYETTESFDLDLTGSDGDFGQKNENVSLFGSTLAPDLKIANVDGVFVGHDHVNNYSILYDGIRYTYGTKTGTYDYTNSAVLGGTTIKVFIDGKFQVAHKYLDSEEMKNRKSASLTITVMTDMHFDTTDYGDFHCTQSEEKLKQIVSETQGSRFYVNLGDTVNSLPDGRLNNFYDAMRVMKELDLNVYNSEGTGYTEGGRMIYNLAGNHEAAYVEKSVLKDYIPYVENVGDVGVFRYEDLMFVAVDAIFDRSGSDEPAVILGNGSPCTEFTIPDEVFDWLQAEVASQMDGNVKGIVWICHIALKDIDDVSKNRLLGELKNYGLPITVFEGHTHQEAYAELTDDITGEVYCQVYTLPAVTLVENYPYYNVTFKDGKVWCVDKHTAQTI